MKIVIDALPLRSGHRFRGVGFYTKNLISAIKTVDEKNKYYFDVLPETVKKADLIHYPYFSPFLVTLPLFKKKKLVVTIHDLIPLVFPKAYPLGVKGSFRFLTQKFLVKKVEAVITDSEFSKKDIIKFLGVRPEKIKVIYLAPGSCFRKMKLGLKQMSSLSRKYHLPKKFVLYVGDVNYNKNIKGLVRAFKNVKTRYQNLKLVLVGKAFRDKNLAESKEIRFLIENLDLQDEVVMTGFVSDEDLAAIYNLASVYCQPSFYEGFGLPVLEAMACGCPVVAAKTSGLSEIGGEALLLTGVGSSDLARAIGLVLNDSRLRIDLVKKGLRQVKKFSWQKTAKETIRVYEEVFGK